MNCDSFSIWFWRPIAETAGVVLMVFGFALSLWLFALTLKLLDRFLWKRGNK